VPPRRDDLLLILGVTIRFDKWWVGIAILSIAKTSIYMYDCLEERLKGIKHGPAAKLCALGLQWRRSHVRP
jgi:hypothetical protein